MECIATYPETALHLNTKYHLADVLTKAIGKALSLRIRRNCVVGNRPYITGGDVTWMESREQPCPQFEDSVLVPAWDEVRTESRVSDEHELPQETE